MKNLNVYDFDKTIYKKDASLEFWKYCVSRNICLLLLFPYQFVFLILNKLKIVSTKTFKQEFFVFLKYISKAKLAELIREFWHKEIQNLDNRIIDIIKNSEWENVCISASPKFILEIPCEFLKIDFLIATNLNLETYLIEGENCKGKAKVIALNNCFNEYQIENFYSDSYSDLPLFNIAKNGYLVKKNIIEIINENKGE